MRLLNGLCLQLRVIRLLEAGIGGLGESIETAGICSVVSTYSLGKTMVVAAGQVDHGSNVLTVHHREQFLRSSEIFAIGRKFHPFLGFRRARDVGMKVYQWKF